MKPLHVMFMRGVIVKKRYLIQSKDTWSKATSMFVFSKEEFQQRYSDTETEMLLSCAVNSFFSIIMLIPVWFTGRINPFNIYISIFSIKSSHGYPYQENIFGLDIQYDSNF